MILNLIDLNKGMIQAWQKWFKDVPNVNIIEGSIFDTHVDALVSPANSFGFMDGGLDLQISQNLGWSIQERLQRIIQFEYNGELLVGQSITVPTGNGYIPYVISAPTMRVPMELIDSINPYLAARAVFIEVRNNSALESVSISGLGTLTGGVSSEICAKQMKKAYDDIAMGNRTYPKSWFDSKNIHIGLTQ